MRPVVITCRAIVAAAILGGAMLVAPPTAAQDVQPPAAPPAPMAPTSEPAPARSGIGVQGFGLIGVNMPVPVESFEAVGLPTRPSEVGGGARVTRLWRGLFAQAAWSHWKESGERSFIDSAGRRFPLGIPLDVEVSFLDISAGWRFEGRSRFIPYLGAGAGVAKYRESSLFDASGENVDTRQTSYHVLGGADVRLARWLWVGGEARYRFVPGILGEGGVSAELDEREFNGAAVTARIAVGF
ncbi:MAG TPA: hypothetical protein VF198_11175 [Vicinamibacterales bacterium]